MKKRTMERRKLEELNLLDNFLFTVTLSHTKYGEEFGRALLQTIFGREFGRLKVIPQKVYYGVNTDKHGIQLDVYLEEEDAGALEGVTVYDIEPDQTKEAEDREALPKRVRFYHSKIDAGILESGKKYQALKRVIIIMITPYDPFGRDRMVYTIKNFCQEEPDMEYEDGVRTIFLYTRGVKGDPPEELRQLLQYMEQTVEENAKNDTLKGFQRIVDEVKKDGEVLKGYMKLWELEEMWKREGRREEQKKTEEEKKRAERERIRAENAEEKIRYLEEEIQKLKG